MNKKKKLYRNVDRSIEKKMSTSLNISKDIIKINNNYKKSTLTNTHFSPFWNKSKFFTIVSKKIIINIISFYWYF